jgi:hypothetical protein
LPCGHEAKFVRPSRIALARTLELEPEAGDVTLDPGVGLLSGAGVAARDVQGHGGLKSRCIFCGLGVGFAVDDRTLNLPALRAYRPDANQRESSHTSHRK